MKRYLPFVAFVVVILYLIWRAWPKVVKAREGRQEELDNILNPDAAAPAGSGEDLTAALDSAAAA